ncbi:glycoside hydrolase family protein [Pontiellaceae bacterium B12227]|nr:glycoside hydrolase family protein [Pontiellaceae bacterium B12227]
MMTIKKNVLIYVLVLLGATSAFSGEDTLNLKARMEFPEESFAALGKRHAVPYIFADRDWYQWGCGVIKGGDGKFHMFYARWPQAYGHSAWLTHSEIAHAVSERPEGPYAYVDTTLSRVGGEWDAIQAHNPKIMKFGNKYYLYYIATQFDAEKKPATQDELIEIARRGGKGPRWNELRNNQRIGVAVSDSLCGPWKRCATPLIEPAGPIKNITVNPTVCQGGNGRFYMMLKGDTAGTDKWHRSQAIAIADTPEGPFVIQPKAAISDFDTEDADIWFDANRERFYALFHMHKNIGLITCEDGMNWQKAKSFKVTPDKVFFKTGIGEKYSVKRVERPFLLRDDRGSPVLLFAAVLDGQVSYNISLGFE